MTKQSCQRIKHLLSMNDLTGQEINYLIDEGIKIKKSPGKWASSLTQKSMLMIFAKPSLRTRLSFEVAMTQLGGHAIYYDISTSPLGKGKETSGDTAMGASGYADIIMARLFEHSHLEELAHNCKVPVINGLTNFEHPCQVLADLMTVKEVFGKLKGLKLVYLGDGNNNIPHSLLFACPKVGMNIGIAAPCGKEFEPDERVLKIAHELAKKNKVKVETSPDPNKIVEDADIIVTDSWMSYHIPKEKEEERIEIFMPYQVNAQIMKKAKPTAIFMHCLPATRGQEVTAEVIDGNQSVVWQEAENRLHIQKAIILYLLNKLARKIPHRKSN
ncbi:MAG: ornithine carbamoyltransferase [Planctomycetota bacterium]